MTKMNHKASKKTSPPMDERPTHTALATVEIDGWQLATSPEWTDGDLRIQDIELAKRLGFKEPRAIRKLIARHGENFAPGDVRDTVSRTRVGAAIRNVTSYWLTESAALFIVTKSETPNAVALTKEMIRVFMLARRGLLPQQTQAIDPTVIAAAIAEAVAAPLAARLEALEQRMASNANDPGGTVGPYVAKQIGVRISQVARSRSQRDQSRSFRSHRASIEQAIRSRVNWMGGGTRWAFLPTSRRGELERELDMVERVERGIEEGLAAKAKAEGNAKQTSMPWGSN